MVASQSIGDVLHAGEHTDLRPLCASRSRATQPVTDTTQTAQVTGESPIFLFRDHTPKTCDHKMYKYPPIMQFLEKNVLFTVLGRIDCMKPQQQTGR